MRLASRRAHRKPRLTSKISATDFSNYYWLQAELVRFARKLGLPTRGNKPALCKRIERRLRGLPANTEQKSQPPRGPRDSDRSLRRATTVVRYKSDAKTRAFFASQIGPEFHFTYHLNQFRIARRELTYGDLIDEWLAERARRRSSGYQPPIAEHGRYNRFVRDFFADTANRGKSLAHAAAAWNTAKNLKKGARYQRRKR